MVFVYLVGIMLENMVNFSNLIKCSICLLKGRNCFSTLVLQVFKVANIYSFFIQTDSKQFTIVKFAKLVHIFI